MKNTPNQYILHGRNDKYDILCEDGRVYFGMGGTPVPFIRDLETEKFREPIKKDMEQATRLGDYLPNMSYIMSIAGSYDMPYEVQYIHDFDALFNNTEKPIIYAAPGSLNTELVLEMASTIVGGEDKLKKRPILSIYCETSSPLSFSRENENIIAFV